MTNWAEKLTKIRQERAAEIAERRARVLQYPDLAQRLTERPLNFAKPELWNGYVPPKTVPSADGYVINTSPLRAALVEICAEAKARDDDAEPTGEQCDCGAYRDPDGICRACQTREISS